jgi:hypothetical protein
VVLGFFFGWVEGLFVGIWNFSLAEFSFTYKVKSLFFVNKLFYLQKIGIQQKKNPKLIESRCCKHVFCNRCRMGGRGGRRPPRGGSP